MRCSSSGCYCSAENLRPAEVVRFSGRWRWRRPPKEDRPMFERLQRLVSRRNRSESAASERFTEGTRSLRDLVAPSAIETKPTHLTIDKQYLKVLALADYPRYVHPNWLGRLID